MLPVVFCAWNTGATSLTIRGYTGIVRPVNPPTVSPARPGQFAANFNPELLDSFRNQCKAEGRQYSKVLERMAEMYVLSNGEILNWADTIDQLTDKILQLEQKLSFARNRNEEASEAGHSPPSTQEPGAPPEGWEEDLLEFYPPEELRDWKQGFAVMKCSMMELHEQIQLLQKELMVLGMTPHKRPKDDLSIDDEDED